MVRRRDHECRPGGHSPAGGLRVEFQWRSVEYVQHAQYLEFIERAGDHHGFGRAGDHGRYGNPRAGRQRWLRRPG